MASFKKVQVKLVDAKYEVGLRFFGMAEDVRIFSDHWFSHKRIN